jgi:membrane-associated phospholipid phosphatase
MLKPIPLLFCALLLCTSVFSQSDSIRKKVYNVKWKYELPASTVFLIGSSFGFKELDKVSSFKPEDVVNLNPNDVNSFDRSVIFQDPKGFAAAHKTSNHYLNFSVLSPIILALDKDIRRDWLDLISLYLVSHSIDNTIYFAAAFPVRRARPLTYNPDLPVEDKIGRAKSNSFFSGHVSFSATSTFFLVKVFTDYHEIKGWKRIALYGAASIPPAMVGYYRVKAGRHFKTDVMLGYLIGATSGIVVPEMHRRKKKENAWSLTPFYNNDYSGVTLNIPLNK